MKISYRPDELSDLFNASKRQIYRLIADGYLKVSTPSKRGCRITSESVNNYLEKYIINCTLPIYKPSQIASFLCISKRSIISAISRGDIEWMKLNPTAKNNKSIRIPLLTPKNAKRFLFLENIPVITYPICLPIKKIAKILKLHVNKVHELLDLGKLIGDERRATIPSVITYLVEQGNSISDAKKKIGISSWRCALAVYNPQYLQPEIYPLIDYWNHLTPSEIEKLN